MINVYSCMAAFLSSVNLLISLVAFIRTAIAWLTSFTASSRCCCTLTSASRYSLRSLKAMSHWRIAAVHCCFKPLRSRIYTNRINVMQNYPVRNIVQNILFVSQMIVISKYIRDPILEMVNLSRDEI